MCTYSPLVRNRKQGILVDHFPYYYNSNKSECFRENLCKRHRRITGSKQKKKIQLRTRARKFFFDFDGYFNGTNKHQYFPRKVSHKLRNIVDFQFDVDTIWKKSQIFNITVQLYQNNVYRAFIDCLFDTWERSFEFITST